MTYYVIGCLVAVALAGIAVAMARRDMRAADRWAADCEDTAAVLEARNRVLRSNEQRLLEENADLGLQLHNCQARFNQLQRVAETQVNTIDRNSVTIRNMTRTHLMLLDEVDRLSTEHAALLLADVATVTHIEEGTHAKR